MTVREDVIFSQSVLTMYLYLLCLSYWLKSTPILFILNHSTCHKKYIHSTRCWKFMNGSMKDEIYYAINDPCIVGAQYGVYEPIIVRYNLCHSHGTFGCSCCFNGSCSSCLCHYCWFCGNCWTRSRWFWSWSETSCSCRFGSNNIRKWIDRSLHNNHDIEEIECSDGLNSGAKKKKKKKKEPAKFNLAPRKRFRKKKAERSILCDLDDSSVDQPLKSKKRKTFKSTAMASPTSSDENGWYSRNSCHPLFKPQDHH